MAYKINHADILDWAKNYDGEPFDGILCDPPYELGFMGKSWDSTGIAFNVELWTELLRICKPGAHLLAFSGSRTYHRMACAIEDAGFEIRDMIEWVYGSGFPKSLNIAKMLDKMEGVEHPKNTPISDNGSMSGANYTRNKMDVQSELAKQWEGYGTALKPAHEPCVLARKPIKGTVANNCLEHGTGGLNIDGTRIAAEPELAKNWTNRKAKAGFGNAVNVFTPDTTAGTIENFDYYQAAGRFPANLIHDGSDEVEAVFPQTIKGSKASGLTKTKARSWKNTSIAGINRTGYEDNGSASRFFYTAKASKSERNAGLEGFEPKQTWASQDKREASSFDVFESDGRPKTVNANHHPTVKPLALTKYLANLIKPPKGGRLLVPFSGSGSEMIGALQAGWEYVEGVELTEEYIPIAEARIKYWLDKIDKQLEIL